MISPHIDGLCVVHVVPVESLLNCVLTTACTIQSPAFSRGAQYNAVYSRGRIEKIEGSPGLEHNHLFLCSQSIKFAVSSANNDALSKLASRVCSKPNLSQAIWAMRRSLILSANHPITQQRGFHTAPEGFWRRQTRLGIPREITALKVAACFMR